MSAVLSQAEAMNAGLSQAEAMNAGLSQAEAVNAGLRQGEAVNAGLRQAEAMNAGLSQAEAMNAGLREVDATYGAQRTAGTVSAEMARYFESPSYDVMRGLLRPEVLPQSFAASLKFPLWMQNLADATRVISVQYGSMLNTEIGALARESERQAAWIQGVKSAASPALSMFADELLASSLGGGLSPALAEGFGAQVLSYINETKDAQTKEERDAVLQEFFVWFFEQFKRLPRTVLSAEGMLNIFFLLVSLLDNHWLSAGTDRHTDRAVSGLESRVDERLERIEEGQKKILEELREVKAPRVTYVIMESAQLREGPGEGIQGPPDPAPESPR